MLRAKLLLILFTTFSISILTSCSDTTTDPGEDNGGEEPIEPTASVNNPNEGANLEGEVTFAIDGEAENGFNEARIFVGDEQIETVENPSLPYEQTVTTYNYDNGDYDLSAELDVAEEDTSIEASVSTTFENYMVTLDTDGYIEMLNEYYKAAYLFIADPDGNVLREIELTAQTDGEIKLLPPSQLKDGAPDNFNVTLARARTFGERDDFYLSTDTGLKPWSRLYKEGSIASDEEEPSTRELSIEMSNFDQIPLYTHFFTADYSKNVFYEEHQDSDLSTTLEVTEGLDDLVITHTPDYTNVENATPVYRWEDNLAELDDTVTYNVSEDFNKMVSHSVSVPSNIEVRQYRYFMTIASDSFDEGDMYFGFWRPSQIGDANGDEAGLGMWVPEISERSFITYMSGRDQSDDNIYYSFQTSVMDGFPSEYSTVDAEAQINNKTLDDFQVEFSGNFDYSRVYASHSSDNYHHSWSVTLPDSATSFIFPQIADSLDDAVNNYNRSEFELSSLSMYNYGKYEGYTDYLDSYYSDTDYGPIIEWTSKYKLLSSQSKRKSVGPEPEEPNNGVIDFSNREMFMLKGENRLEKEVQGIYYEN